jgi:hypothetical protein
METKLFKKRSKLNLMFRKRFKYNILILFKLLKEVIVYPDLRFCQILSILKLDSDRFYEEPNVTYNTLKELNKKK